MKRVLLVDTDVMVDYLRGNDAAVNYIKANASRIILSSIVVAELYAGVKGEKELSILDELISMFRVISVSTAIARAGGLYKRDFGKAHGVGLADALIAATAESESAELATFNLKHYPMFAELRPPYSGH